MKKLLIAVGLSLACAMPAQAFFKAKAETVVDDFDGSKLVKIRTGGLDCAAKQVLCPMIGFAWFPDKPDSLYIRTDMYDMYLRNYYNIKKLQISVDGDIRSFDAIATTDYYSDTVGTTSTQLFPVPAEYIDILKTNKNIKIRLVTDRGNYDGAFTGGKRQSVADKHYRLFLDEMAKHTAP